MKKGIIYAALTAVLFATLEPVSKLIADRLNPYAITCLRFFIGGLVLLPFGIAKLKKENIKIELSEYVKMTLLGILMMFSMVVLQLAVKVGPNPSFTSIVFSSNSMFTIILAVFLLKEKLTTKKIIGILMCVVGICLLVDLKSGSNVQSILLSLVAAVGLSTYTVLCKKLVGRLLGVVQTSFSFIVGSLVLYIVLVVSGIPVISAVTVDMAGNLIYLSLLVTGVGYWAYFKAMEKGGALAASTSFLIKPILAPFVTLFVNSIVPGGKVFLALFFVVVGSVTIAYGKK